MSDIFNGNVPLSPEEQARWNARPDIDLLLNRVTRLMCKCRYPGISFHAERTPDIVWLCAIKDDIASSRVLVETVWSDGQIVAALYHSVLELAYNEANNSFEYDNTKIYADELDPDQLRDIVDPPYPDTPLEN
jgi:hypothetical protein